MSIVPMNAAFNIIDADALSPVFTITAVSCGRGKKMALAVPPIVPLKLFPVAQLPPAAVTQ
jgi:hypothetical protein